MREGGAEDEEEKEGGEKEEREIDEENSTSGFKSEVWHDNPLHSSSCS